MKIKSLVPFRTLTIIKGLFQWQRTQFVKAKCILTSLLCSVAFYSVVMHLCPPVNVKPRSVRGFYCFHRPIFCYRTSGELQAFFLFQVPYPVWWPLISVEMPHHNTLVIASSISFTLHCPQRNKGFHNCKLSSFSLFIYSFYKSKEYFWHLTNVEEGILLRNNF